ncbi:MAG: c-type cytochrome [Gemmatimonadota bacterium]
MYGIFAPRHLTSMALGLTLVLMGCGGGDAPSGDSSDRADGRSAPATLTDFQLAHGIGPITTEVELGELDAERAERGKELYQFNCEACHFLEDRFVGPPLGDVLERRTGTYVMNQILNPEEMARQHPEAQKLLTEYPLVMPFQNITEDEARAIVEYLRIAKEQ